MKTITPKQAKKIIKIACPEWQLELMDKWGASIVLDKEILIEESFYKKMRKACTQEQHELFDKIFGKDEENLKKEDWVYVTSDGGDFHKNKGDIFRVLSVKGSVALFETDAGVSKHRLRKATPEEIKAHLIEECNKRGIWDVPVRDVWGYSRGRVSFGTWYVKGHDVFWSKYGRVYEKGKFATPLEEEKQYPPEGTVCFVWDDDDDESKSAYGVVAVSLGNGRYIQYTLDIDLNGHKYDNFEIYDPKKHFKTRK